MQTNVKEQKQWDKERRDQAQWQDRHRDHRSAVRAKPDCGRTQAYGHNQIENSKLLPNDEAPAMAGIGELPCDEGCCRPDGPVAISGGPSKYCRLAKALARW